MYHHKNYQQPCRDNLQTTQNNSNQQSNPVEHEASDDEHSFDIRCEVCEKNFFDLER